MKFVRSMRDTEPWKSGIVREVLPGPDCQSDDDLRGKSFFEETSKLADVVVS